MATIFPREEKAEALFGEILKNPEACHRLMETFNDSLDMADVLDALKAADVIVLASPVYFYSICAQMKTMIDRCLAGYQEIRNKTFYLIVTAADPQHSAADETLADFRGYLRCLPGAKEAGVIFGTGTWDKGDVYRHPSLKQAYEMGKSI